MTTPSTAAHTHTLQDMQVPQVPQFQHRHADVAAALSTRLKILYQLFPPLRNLFTSDVTLNAIAGPTHCGSHVFAMLLPHVLNSSGILMTFGHDEKLMIMENPTGMIKIV